MISAAAGQVRPFAVRVFAAPAAQPRARRASDLIVLVPAVLALAVAIAVYPPGAAQLALARTLRSLPGWLDPVWEAMSAALWLWSGALVLAALARRRVFVCSQALAALVLAAVAVAVSGRLTAGAWPAVLSTRTDFPVAWVAETVAVGATVAPHLVRPLQRLGRRMLAVGVLGAAISTAATPDAIVAALLIGLAVAAAIRLAWGTSAGRPTLEDVAAGLAELGIEAHGLEDAERQSAGTFSVRASERDGGALVVKVYGRDAYDTQRLARVWRRLWYRGAAGGGWSSRLGAAEHEAFVTMLAAGGGILTRRVLTAATTQRDDALLVLRGETAPLAAASVAAWQALERLRALRIAHQRIDPATAVLVEGGAGFVDFGSAEVAPSAHQLQTDRAQLLLTTACHAGPDAALDAAVSVIGEDGLADVLAYMQPAALGPGLRRALKAAELDIDAVRAQAASVAGVDPPELVRLRRITVSTVVQAALLVLASSTILTAAGHVDWQQVGSSIAHATWGWLALGLVVAQGARVGQAVATLGAVPIALPFGPVYVMQLASGYMNVALPSSVGRMAVNVRFLQRQGLPLAGSVTAGVIDTVATATVQAVMLVLLLLLSEATLELDVRGPSPGMRTIAWILLAALAVVAAVALTPRVRRAIAGLARRWWPDVRAALAALSGSGKLARIALGNALAELLLAVALGLVAQGLGHRVELTQLLAIQLSVSLLAGLIPVPGGIGVSELILTLGLTTAGMPPESALAAALLFRIATFYLPPLWGFVAFRWLQRNRYL